MSSLDSIAGLRRALRAGEVAPYFQPQFDLRTGKLYRFEISVRWNHPVLGPIPLEEFFGLAEAGDLIGPVTDTVTAAAAEAAMTTLKPLQIAVRISVPEMRDWRLPERLRSAVEQGGFPISRLIVQIPESALIGNLDLAQAIAGDLKALGASLALRGFGTGHSSLIHLQVVPFDEMQIDTRFVSSMRRYPEGCKLVAALVGLGKSLGLRTVAEGVEDEREAVMLARIGCDYAQGSFWGMPQSAAKALQQIGDNRGRLRVAELPGFGAFLHSRFSSAEPWAELQAIYEGAPVGFCFFDRDLRYVGVNRQLAEIHGIPPEEHLGRTIAQVMPDVAAKLEPSLRRALEGEASTAINLLLGSEGRQRTLLIYCSPARDLTGDVIGVSVAALETGSNSSDPISLQPVTEKKDKIA